MTEQKILAEVLIYQPQKNAMQSGVYKAKQWFMKFVNYAELDEAYIFNLMNWQGGKDTLKTIVLPFKAKEDAISFASKNGFSYKLEESSKRKIKPKSYTANFI
jgi:NADH dehydrogenase (ubiquinone) Fe-S protein 4